MAKYKDLEAKTLIIDEDTLLVNGNSTVSMSKVKEYSKPNDATQKTSGLMSAEDKKKLDSLSLSSSIKTIRIAHFGIGATPQKMGEYSYNPQTNKVTYSNPDIQSSEQFDPMPDTLYINDDEESDYPLGIYAMDANGKLASITGFVM